VSEVVEESEVVDIVIPVVEVPRVSAAEVVESLSLPVVGLGVVGPLDPVLPVDDVVIPVIVVPVDPVATEVDGSVDPVASLALSLVASPLRLHAKARASGRTREIRPKEKRCARGRRWRAMDRRIYPR